MYLFLAIPIAQLSHPVTIRALRILAPLDGIEKQTHYRYLLNSSKERHGRYNEILA
ncbi:MAG: hypothetical protein LBD23_05020 [Oscillospiraceae bacterium]|jgi:hypothetical protein|nr:hypothetical protein [Oscillospiraceae bacterium]